MGEESKKKHRDAIRLPEESVLLICANTKCGKKIGEPIRLTNLSVTPPEQYDACPFCFTKLEIEPVNEEVTQSENAALEAKEDAGSQLMRKVEGLILGSNEHHEKENQTGCPEAFGYLANRPKGSPIPQECLLCPKIVDCMLITQE
jgi:hypothetical protein